MRRRRSQLHLVFRAALLAASLAAAAQAQDKYPYRASAFVGLGGPISSGDGDSSSLDHGSYQLGFSWISDTDILVGVRYGQIDFGDDEGVGGRSGSDLTYATIGGEYLFNEGYYTSGVYLGLGWYDVGEDDLGEIGSDSAIGFALGLTGDFRLTQRFSILVELSGHYTDLDDADLLAMGHAGVAYRF
jgi:hypothetical protein